MSRIVCSRSAADSLRGVDRQGSGSAESAYSGYATHQAQLSRDFTISVYHHAAVVAACGQPDDDALAALREPSRPEGIDECELTDSEQPPGRVCVLVTVRWRRALAASPMTVWSYAGAGEGALSTVELPASAGGVVAMLLPADSTAPMFVRAMMDRDVSGTIAAGAYSYQMHVATHAFLLPPMELDPGEHRFEDGAFSFFFGFRAVSGHFGPPFWGYK